MDFNVKRLAADAGTFLTRAVQFTEEKLGQAEKTELDAHLENLLGRAENTKQWTEKIMKQTEVLLQPNPNVRLEEFVYEKLEKKVPTRLNNHEMLGQTMIDSGNEFGPGTAYGNALIKCGETEKQIGGAERELIQSAAINFLTPFRNFLEGDFKTILKERKLLQVKRLDLDAAKTRLKKARVGDARAVAEQELRMTQSEFDRQAEITRLLLEGVSSTHFPVVILQQQPVVAVRRRQHLGAHHPSDGLSAQRVRGTRGLRRVGRFQRTAQLQRQPQSQSAVRLRRRQQQRAFPAGRRGQCEVGALSLGQTEIKRELLILDLSLLDFSISQADSFFFSSRPQRPVLHEAALNAADSSPFLCNFHTIRGLWWTDSSTGITSVITFSTHYTHSNYTLGGKNYFPVPSALTQP
uniref:SH3-domain GRB2-like endophilin B1a n=1 Tax=Cynoglossus semilaevis TaxID=244447 RepID=A0A3P8W0H8_CYNSE